MIRKINIKQLYGNLSKEMKELPFAVTKRGEIIGYMSLDPPVESLDKKAKNSLDKPVESRQEPEKISKSKKPGRSETRRKYQESHPREICIQCGNLNKDCECG